MKPAPFDYVAPHDLEELLSLRSQHGDDAKILAGGQSLIPVLNFRLAKPSMLIDINRVSGLDGIGRSDDGSLSLGAMVRQSRAEIDPDVARLAPLLHAAIPFIAHPQIRNRGTVGGSLAHADPAAELPAVAIALEARFRLANHSRSRWVEAGEFYTGLFSTELEPDEVLVEVRIPASKSDCGWGFEEFARRHGDYAQAGLVATLSLHRDGTCKQAKLVYFSVGETPIEARRAAAVLQGIEPNSAAIAEAAEIAASEEVDPSSDIHSSAQFKRHLCRVLTTRVVEVALQRARARSDGGQIES